MSYKFPAVSFQKQLVGVHVKYPPGSTVGTLGAQLVALCKAEKC